MDVRSAVREVYSRSAKESQGLCCPVNYDPALLAVLPQEIVDKDYGCGDPSRYVLPGDVVLDLGSGGGKVCYMIAQLVGAQGRVIGVDMNDDMLTLARKYQSEIAAKLGTDRVQFVKGYIQDLALDVTEMEEYLRNRPVTHAADLDALNAWCLRQRQERPLIPDNSIDLVISNCVLNLVEEADRVRMVKEIFRVLKPGGRIAISDIVSDEIVPSELRNDQTLWTKCISGAFQEAEFIQIFRAAGFNAVSYGNWDTQPWQVLEGIEFRSVTVTAIKPDTGACIDFGHAVVYRGPYAQVTDDEGHIYFRGERMAVCERTFRFLTQGPCQRDFIGLTPAEKRAGIPWCAAPGTRRPPGETKGSVYSETARNASCDTPGCC